MNAEKEGNKENMKKKIRKRNGKRKRDDGHTEEQVSESQLVCSEFPSYVTSSLRHGYRRPAQLDSRPLMHARESLIHSCRCALPTNAILKVFDSSTRLRFTYTGI